PGRGQDQVGDVDGDGHGSSKRYAVVLPFAVARNLPSGANARLRAGPPKSQWRSSRPVACSQSLTALSSPAVAKRRPSGLTAKAWTRPRWAANVRTGLSRRA